MKNLEGLSYAQLETLWHNLMWVYEQESLPPEGVFRILEVEQVLNEAYDAMTDEEKKGLEGEA